MTAHSALWQGHFKLKNSPPPNEKFPKIPVTENEQFSPGIPVNVISLTVIMVCETVIKRMPTLQNVIPVLYGIICYSHRSVYRNNRTDNNNKSKIPGQCLRCCHHAEAALREFTLVHGMSAARRQVAADLWTKPIGLNHKPACRLPVNYTHHRLFYYYSARKLILILPSHGRQKAESTYTVSQKNMYLHFQQYL